MERKLRLNKSADIQLVRRSGKSYQHPLFILIVMHVEPEEPARVGIIATKSVGGAVQRNRAKRLLRTAVFNCYSRLPKGIRILLIARAPLAKSNIHAAEPALEEQLKKAGLI